jgi:hypothetical protein
LADKLGRYIDSGLWFLDDAAAAAVRRDPRGSAPDPPDVTANEVPPVSTRQPGQSPPLDVADAADEAAAALLELLDRVRSDRDALAARVDAMQRSTSWRLTAPLRSMGDAWVRRRG